MPNRWLTFDCYGTLVDWDAGIGAELARLFGDAPVDELLARYHAIEPRVQAAEPGSSYWAVLEKSLERLSEESGLPLPTGEAGALGRSLPRWPVFADVRPALEEARAHNWRLGILSNTDRDFLDASMAAIGVPFDASIVASEIGSYKPGRRHWEVFGKEYGDDAAAHIHVAQSVYHDIAPAYELGIPSIWINRRGEPADARPRATLSSLAGLASALEEFA